MTTIALNREEMASDSQCTDAGAQVGVRKMWRSQDFIVGVCGDLSHGVLFAQWYLTGADTDNIPEIGDSFEAAVLCRDGTILTYDSSLVAVEILDPFYAIGTGKHAALGAMHAGLGPREAVRVARKIDVFTGGRIRSFKR